jgi:hypothetical protein
VAGGDDARPVKSIAHVRLFQRFAKSEYGVCRLIR